MFSAFFGQYLLEKKIVSARKLNEILAKQEKTRLKLGTLAINEKYMTALQVEEVHDLQATMDRRFGDIAIEKGYLKEQQLDSLLAKQKLEHLILAQTLIDEKVMTMSQFEKELEGYKKTCSLSDEAFKGLKNNDVDLLVRAFLAFDEEAQSEVYVDYIALFIKNLIRFIDRNVCFDRITKVKHKKIKHLTLQNVKGDVSFFTGIGADTKTFLKMAGNYADESFEKVEEYPIDAVGEFLNLHNGLFTVNLSNIGKQTSIDIQSYIEDATLNPMGKLYCIPIKTAIGEIQLYVGKLY